MEQSIAQDSKSLSHSELSSKKGGYRPRSGRSFGLDLVRFFTIFAVVGGHFFSLHTAFRLTPMVGLSMLIQADIPLSRFSAIATASSEPHYQS